MKLYAVITTHDRHEWLYALVRRLVDDDVEVVVVDNASDPPVRGDLCYVIRDNEQPPNLSRLWNLGLTWVHRHNNIHNDGDKYAVAVLNDDLMVPINFIQTLADKLEEYAVDVAFPDQFGHGIDIVDRSPPGPCVDFMKRMTGYAFVLNGDISPQANEELSWWCGDVDLEMRARACCGTVLVGGVSVIHHDANGSTMRNPLLSEQAGKDRQTFKTIWGFPDF